MKYKQKFVSHFIILLTLILAIININAQNKKIYYEKKIQKVGPEETKRLEQYFLTNFLTDVVVEKYIKFINTIVRDVAFEDDIENGCLQLKITNVYKLYGDYFFELSCDCCSRYCQDFPSTEKNGCILVYLKQDGKLKRINGNLPLFKTEWEIKSKDKAIQLLESYFKERHIKPNSEEKETIAEIFISFLNLSNVGQIPEKLEIISKSRIHGNEQLTVLSDYGYAKCEYTFTFGSNNKILSVKMRCL